MKLKSINNFYYEIISRYFQTLDGLVGYYLYQYEIQKPKDKEYWLKLQKQKSSNQFAKPHFKSYDEDELIEFHVKFSNIQKIFFRLFCEKMDLEFENPKESLEIRRIEASLDYQEYRYKIEQQCLTN